MSYWKGRSAVVTGAGSGIGRALSGALVRRGASVWLSDIDGDAARAARAELGGNTHALALDVVDAAAVRAHIEDVARAHGRIDFVFNNAGIGVGGDFREMNNAHFDRSIDVNIRGVVNGTLAAYPLMVAQGGGHIVSTASAAGLLPVPLMVAYSMTKHAVVGMSSSLRFEAAGHNVRVSALCPAAIETPLLDTRIAQDMGATWRPDIRAFLTKIGGAPYPVGKFVDYALDRLERNEGLIVAPLGARLRLRAARLFPGLVSLITRKAYRETLAERPDA